MSIQEVAVDLPVHEDMVGDATHPAFTGDHSFAARFQLRVDSDNCAITVIVRVHLVGAHVNAAQEAAWQAAVAAKWNNRFKLCCDDDCANGYIISCELQFVPDAGDAHYTVTAHQAAAPVGADLSNWNIGDNVDVTHEFGHMVGNPDEYFTVNGNNYGPGRQTPNNVMNNPAELPESKHLSMIRSVSEALLGQGTHCKARRVSEPCR